MSPKFESDFSEAVLVLNTSLAEEEKSLYLLSNRVWDQIIQEKYQFDIKEQKMYQLSKISPQSFQELYFNKILKRSELRKLTVVVHGQGKKTKLNVDCDIILDKIEQTETDITSACK